MDINPDSRFGAPDLGLEGDIKLPPPLLGHEDEGGKEVGVLLSEGRHIEEATLLVGHDLHIVQVSSLAVEPLDHLIDVDSPLAGDATLARKVQGEFFHHGGGRHGDERKRRGSVEADEEEAWMRRRRWWRKRGRNEEEARGREEEARERRW